MALPIASLIGLGTSLIGGLFGRSQQKSADALERSIDRPDAQVNGNLIQNLALSEQMANIGLPQQQYINALQNIQRNQNAGLRQASRSAGTGSIASIVRAGNDATANLDVTDANARLQNQQLAMQNRGVLAQEENRVWDYNERQRYNEVMQRAAALRGAGNANTFGALGNVAQMAIGGVFGGQNGLNLGGLFGGGNNQRVNTQGLGGTSMGVTSPTNPFNNLQQLPTWQTQ